MANSLRICLHRRPSQCRQIYPAECTGRRKVAITAPQAQTTRTTLQGVVTTEDAQIVFVDTPGIHKSDTLFNRRMMETVRGALAGRDLILYVIDATRRPGEEDEHAVSALDKSTKALLILNKIDDVDDKRTLLPLIERYAAMFPFSGSSRFLRALQTDSMR